MGVVMGTTEEIPFNPKELFRMRNMEFYLSIHHHPQQHDEGEKDVLAQFVAREPDCLDVYFLGHLRRAERNGVPLRQSFLPGQASQDYVFVLDEVTYLEGMPPVLGGRVHPYDLHQDSMGPPLEGIVTLEFSETPTYKVRQSHVFASGPF